MSQNKISSWDEAAYQEVLAAEDELKRQRWLTKISDWNGEAVIDCVEGISYVTDLVDYIGTKIETPAIMNLTTISQEAIATEAGVDILRELWKGFKKEPSVLRGRKHKSSPVVYDTQANKKKRTDSCTDFLQDGGYVNDSELVDIMRKVSIGGDNLGETLETKADSVCDISKALEAVSIAHEGDKERGSKEEMLWATLAPLLPPLPASSESESSDSEQDSAAGAATSTAYESVALEPQIKLPPNGSCFAVERSTSYESMTLEHQIKPQSGGLNHDCQPPANIAVSIGTSRAAIRAQDEPLAVDEKSVASCSKGTVSSPTLEESSANESTTLEPLIKPQPGKLSSTGSLNCCRNITSSPMLDRGTAYESTTLELQIKPSQARPSSTDGSNCPRSTAYETTTLELQINPQPSGAGDTECIEGYGSAAYETKTLEHQIKPLPSVVNDDGIATERVESIELAERVSSDMGLTSNTQKSSSECSSSEDHSLSNVK